MKSLRDQGIVFSVLSFNVLDIFASSSKFMIHYYKVDCHIISVKDEKIMKIYPLIDVVKLSSLN